MTNGPNKKSQTDKLLITTLINSCCYGFERVFVFEQDGVFHLIAIHNEVLKFEYKSKNLNGLKISFSKKNRPWFQLHDDKGKPVKVKAGWSHFYQADSDWVAKLLEIIARGVKTCQNT